MNSKRPEYIWNSNRYFFYFKTWVTHLFLEWNSKIIPKTRQILKQGKQTSMLEVYQGCRSTFKLFWLFILFSFVGEKCKVNKWLNWKKNTQAKLFFVQPCPAASLAQHAMAIMATKSFQQSMPIINSTIQTFGMIYNKITIDTGVVDSVANNNNKNKKQYNWSSFRIFLLLIKEIKVILIINGVHIKLKFITYHQAHF